MTADNAGLQTIQSAWEALLVTLSRWDWRLVDPIEILEAPGVIKEIK